MLQGHGLKRFSGCLGVTSRPAVLLAAVVPLLLVAGMAPPGAAAGAGGARPSR